MKLRIPFRRVGLLCMALLVASLVATSAHAREDRVTVKRKIGDIYEITISGTRNSDSVEVGVISYARRGLVFNPPAGSGPGLDVYAVIVTGAPSDAVSAYEYSFEYYLPGFLEDVNLYVTDSYADWAMGKWVLVDWVLVDKTIEPEDAYKPRLDFHSAIFEPRPDGFTVRNIGIKGVAQACWGTFRWNPGNLTFELEAAGLDE